MGHKKYDEVTGTETTGHEWDGIEELNKPLPKWWLWTFYVTIVWSVGYWLLMPSWPLVASYTEGLLGYSQRARVAAQLDQSRAGQATMREKIAASDLETISTDPELLRFSLAGGEAAFGDNCAPCHGRGAQGFPGYPNLRDDSWLWGGSLDAIHKTIAYGVRSTHPDTHAGQMPAFGAVLTPAQINDVTDYVLSLSGSASDAASAERGAKIFADSCALCHGAKGGGNPQLGAPNLADELWLYSGDREVVLQTIRNGRAGMMPAWQGRLDPETIKQLAIYVHSLGGGQ